MVKRGGVEEMCSLLLLVAQEEQQKLQQASAKTTPPSEQPSEVRNAPLPSKPFQPYFTYSTVPPRNHQ